MVCCLAYLAWRTDSVTSVQTGVQLRVSVNYCTHSWVLLVQHLDLIRKHLGELSVLPSVGFLLNPAKGCAGPETAQKSRNCNTPDKGVFKTMSSRCTCCVCWNWMSNMAECPAAFCGQSKYSTAWYQLLAWWLLCMISVNPLMLAGVYCRGGESSATNKTCCCDCSLFSQTELVRSLKHCNKTVLTD